MRAHTDAALCRSCEQFEKVVVPGNMGSAQRNRLEPRCVNVGETGAALRCCADASCAAAAASADPNLVQLAQSVEALSTLVQAVIAGGLVDVLTYHVVAGSVLSTDLSSGMRVETVEGGELRVRIKGGNVNIIGGRSNARVVQADVQASNGVAHVIDTVLLPRGGGGH